MYGDIAYHEDNPRPRVVFNSLDGDNVYTGVPKDYAGKNVTINNFLAALRGNKKDNTGGSGKVVESSPNDHTFIFYSDHGGAGVLDNYFELDISPSSDSYIVLVELPVS